MLPEADQIDPFSPQMREFILLSEEYIQAIYDEQVEEILNEEIIVPETRHPVMDDLRDICDRLRAYMESEGGDFGLGVETGMERAAGMIEALIHRYEEN